MYLYIHIPFCISKCDYCDFFSVPCPERIPNSYIEALVSEIKYKVHKYNISEWNTIYVGGGTPSLLSTVQLHFLITNVIKLVNGKSPSEFTVEMNPETLTEEKLDVLRESGVNRISLGIQSLSDKALKNVNRHCSAEKAVFALEKVRSFWKGQFNVDVIAGLPGQNQFEYLDTIKKLITYNPNHFSLYTLTVEDGTPFEKRISSGEEWNSDEADRLWILGRNLLKENGYFQYEVSNFARKGFESIHNKCYWNQEDYIGCGAGACGSIYGFNDNGGVRTTNTTDIDKYIKFWNEQNSFESIPIESFPCCIEKLDLRTEEFEFLMMGFRLLEGVNSSIYKKRFSSLAPFKGDLDKRMNYKNKVYEKFTKEGYIKVYKNTHGDNVYRLTENGILMLNTLLRSLI